VSHSLTYQGSNGSTSYFVLWDRETGEVHEFDFGLRQWLPEANYGFNPNSHESNNNSGVYVFNPKANMTENIQYSDLIESDSFIH